MAYRFQSAPLTDSILVAVSQLVDDAQSDRRDPSHADLEAEFRRFNLTEGDPKTKGQNAGKAKRVKSVLSWAMEHAPEDGGRLVHALIGLIRGHGGFRESSSNYVGKHAHENAAAAFAAEGYELSADGDLAPRLLENLSTTELTEALRKYVNRARKGADDAALVTGTGKDLLEAVAGHVLRQRYGIYSDTQNFPTLLGQAFVACGLATSEDQVLPGEPPHRQIERGLYQAACGVNRLRNKQGTGHGRPWLPTVTGDEARTAIQIMGIVAERLLRELS